MNIQQIKITLKGLYFNSIEWGGVIHFDGLNWTCNSNQINPSKAEIKKLHTEYCVSEAQHLGEFKEGCFYDL